MLMLLSPQTKEHLQCFENLLRQSRHEKIHLLAQLAVSHDTFPASLDLLLAAKCDWTSATPAGLRHRHQYEKLFRVIFSVIRRCPTPFGCDCHFNWPCSQELLLAW